MQQSPCPSAIPNHIAVIMDGNGRWAKKRNLPRTAGHKEGLTVAKNIVRQASSLGVRFLTLYTFSTENWKRAQDEVGFLMNLVKIHLRDEFEFYKENKIRIAHIGDLLGLPDFVQAEIKNAIAETAVFSGMTVVLAINYGGRDELVRASVRAAGALQSVDALGEDAIWQYSDFPESGEVDLLIRTGGEKRLSNFLLWQAAYAELQFSDTLWPDYTAAEFQKAVLDFASRERRFGGV
ncbi:MAG: polyprenyl diphosphate synthase [Treponemataceae bacterium]|nr:MAG: polyprenyl diphosphate synthase [Treponemataceae bacterium]